MDVQRLKNLRENLGYSQKEFSEKIDVSINTYRNWEQGKNEPDTATIIKLAKILNTTVDYLVGFDKHILRDQEINQGEVNSTSGFSETLKKIMKEKGISQGELARKSGIAQSSLSDYLNGKYLPEQDKILAISNAINCSPSLLLLGFERKEDIDQLDLNATEYSILKITQELNDNGQEQVLSYAEQIAELPKYKKSLDMENIDLNSDSKIYVDKNGFLKVIPKGEDYKDLPYVAYSSWKDDHSNDEELADWINKMKQDEIDNQ